MWSTNISSISSIVQEDLCKMIVAFVNREYLTNPGDNDQGMIKAPHVNCAPLSCAPLSLTRALHLKQVKFRRKVLSPHLKILQINEVLVTFD